MKKLKFNVVLLAGDRGPEDRLRQAARVPAKALVPVGGRAMLLRVLEVLRHSTLINEIVIVGPDSEAIASNEALKKVLPNHQQQSMQKQSNGIYWLPPQQGPSASAESGLALLGELQADSSPLPTLITTTDHALLTRTTLESFLHQASQAQADVLAALVDRSAAMQAMPGSQRTGLKFRDGTYCGCNLFAVMSPQGQRVIHFWQKIEHLRKKPLSLLAAIGWWQAIRFRLGRLSLADALEHLGRKTRTHLDIVFLNQAQALAAVDVDSPQDWRLVVRWLQNHPEHDENSLQASQAEAN